MAKKLTDLLQVKQVAPKPERVKLRNKDGEEIITLSLRITRPEWENLMNLMTVERYKMQPYLKRLLKSDFERRGLEF